MAGRPGLRQLERSGNSRGTLVAGSITASKRVVKDIASDEDIDIDEGTSISC